MPTAIQLAKRGLEGIYSYSLFHYDGRMDDVLQHGIELGRSFIQPRYWGRRGLDYLWSGIGAYLARYPHYRYLFGPVSISGGLPAAARDLLVAFYRMWFPATHPLAESRRPYPASLPDVLAQFGGEDYNDDLARLKSLLGNLGCAIPPLYKQYSEVCEPGGVRQSALYWRASGCAKIGIKALSRLAARCALAGLWFTVSDGSVARKRRVRRRLRKAAGNVLRGSRLMP